MLITNHYSFCTVVTHTPPSLYTYDALCTVFTHTPSSLYKYDALCTVSTHTPPSLYKYDVYCNGTGKHMQNTFEMNLFTTKRAIQIIINAER